ncbi:response regulator [Actinoplanes sp. RD1]|uniref:response regulator n=1 Tax=Actinoplanes sp. RD1 TaxID=3064538 RepID=UPI00274079FB|nr:response regulator transcription factor [Actinoplanes sp. RD1]
MIRVVLADDEHLVRMGLRVLVDREDDLTVAGEAASGQDTLSVLRRTHPDVLLLDVRMPGMDGLATLRAIAADPGLGGTRVIMVTTFEIDRYIFEALRAGAAGFVLKDTAPADLVRAIRVVAAGEALLSPSVTRRVMSLFSQPGGSVTGIDTLTDREREIVAWVATGHTNEQIARELSLSPATVRTHAGRAMVKLNARTRAQLVVAGVRAGLTVDP